MPGRFLADRPSPAVIDRAPTSTTSVICGCAMLRKALILLGAICIVALAVPTVAFGDTRHVVLSSQTVSVRVQTAPGTSPSAAVVVASGIDGWRGLASDVGERLSTDGYAVIGLDTRSYLIEATRRSGPLSPAAVAEDYLVVLRRVHEWFPDLRRVFLLGVSEGAALAQVAAADPRVGLQLAGVVGLETPGTVSLRSPYWTWTNWITHKDENTVTVAAVDYVAAVAPTPVAFIYGTHDMAGATETAQTIFDRGGEPRRLAVIETERLLFDDAREQLFDTIHDCLAWSTHVTRPSSTQVSVVGVLRSRGTP